MLGRGHRIPADEDGGPGHGQEQPATPRRDTGQRKEVDAGGDRVGGRLAPLQSCKLVFERRIQLIVAAVGGLGDLLSHRRPGGIELRFVSEPDGVLEGDEAAVVQAIGGGQKDVADLGGPDLGPFAEAGQNRWRGQRRIDEHPGGVGADECGRGMPGTDRGPFVFPPQRVGRQGSDRDDAVIGQGLKAYRVRCADHHLSAFPFVPSCLT